MWYFESLCATVESLGVCKNLAENMGLLQFSGAAEITEATTGFHFAEKADFRSQREKTINLERAYHVRKGIRRKDDYLPARFLKKPLRDDEAKEAIFKLGLRFVWMQLRCRMRSKKVTLA